MTDLQSYTFDFQRVSDFFDRWNVSFKTNGDFNENNKFEVVFCNYAYDDISKMLTSSGTLNSGANVYATQNCRLNWTDETITIGGNVTFDLGTSIVPLKALFIRHKKSGVVLGYSININDFEVTNQLVISSGTILWSIRDV